MIFTVPRRHIAFYADDFTGAADALGQYAATGLTTTLLFSIPTAARIKELSKEFDVVGIAGVSRALRGDVFERELTKLFDALGAEFDIIQYKISSTFDSSPTVGSIGAAIDIGRRALGPVAVPVLAAQPQIGRFTVFGNQFTTSADGRVHRLDRYPLSAAHRVTPMSESDLRVHLSAQTSTVVEGIHLQTVRGPFRELVDAWDSAQGRGSVVVFDCLTDEDGATIARAILHLPHYGTAFVVGSGGLSSALARAIGNGNLPPARSVGPSRGPVLVLSGMASPLTSHQIDHALAIDGWAEVILTAEGGVETAVARAAAIVKDGRSVVVHTREPSAIAGRHSVSEAATQLGEVLAMFVQRSGIGRIVIAGGDTAGFALRSACADASASFVTWFEPAVPLLKLAASSELNGAELILKGGQVGTLNVLERVRTGTSQRS